MIGAPWIRHNVLLRDGHLSKINSMKNVFGCEIYINRNRELFKFLLKNKKTIEKELKEKAVWKQAAIASRILITKQVGDVFDQDKATNYNKWLLEKTILFQQVIWKIFQKV
jgi:hypothetical protein